MLKDDILLYRAKENLSQKEMADRCQVTLQTINRIEKGKYSASKLTEAKIKLVMEGGK